MSDSPEVIEAKMEETRENLAEKLEVLGEKVSKTVEKVTETVEETVDTVSETATAVTETALNTAQAVKETFNFPRHIQEHPWLMLGGSVAVGFLGGYLMSGLTRSAHRQSRYAFRQARQQYYQPEYYQPASSYQPTSTGNGHSQSHGVTGYVRSWLDDIREAMGPELERLKGMAIGASLSLLRDMAAEAIPPNFKEQVTEVFDNVTRRLGGEPVSDAQGSLAQMFSHHEEREPHTSTQPHDVQQHAEIT